MKWVEQNELWNFENNLLLRCKWRRGLNHKYKFYSFPFLGSDMGTSL